MLQRENKELLEDAANKMPSIKKTEVMFLTTSEFN
jgi:hypothetical protein